VKKNSFGLLELEMADLERFWRKTPLGPLGVKFQIVVRCSAIEGILHRHHNCGPMLVLEEVAHDWHLGYLGALGLLGAIRYLGAIGLLSLHVDVWRLIFLKLSLPRDGVRGVLCTL
jgi:hypothetical protein